MTPERFQRIKALFLDARDLTPVLRGEFLDTQCADDAVLRGEVEAMLAEHDQSAHSIETPDDGATPGSDPTLRRGASADRSDLPATIGPYRIVQEIGRGGMGLAYLGIRDDGQFKRRVAIKVVKRGMDSEEILTRFELERQVLASLNHPNIARLYDGGMTDDDRPYFVLEYVEGMPIDQYCDVNRLDISQRLELFRAVCSAVHYAHQNLVVHRDLKPANIIVTGEGVPKLLDFGIAKIINPELALLVKDPTAPALRLMTPEYASPEQVRGAMISTASDVYSLGVLLYELLTGHRPYRLRSRIQEELERIICEEEPDRPSTALSRVEEIEEPITDDTGGTTIASRTISPDTVSRSRGGRIDRLRRQLSGDLDNIILMAMRKEPLRRYSSAEQLADDLRRHLELQPVRARPDDVWYRAGKFARRNRGALTAAGLVVLALVIGLIATNWQYRQATRATIAAETAEQAERTQRAAAEKYFAEAVALSEFFMRELNREIDKRGAAAGRKRMADRALGSLQSLGEPATSDPALAALVASMYVTLGDIQGGDRNGNLGELVAARVSYQSALDLYIALGTVEGASDQSSSIAINHLKLSDVYRRLTQTDASRDHLRQALDLVQSLPSEQRDKPSLRRINAILLQSEGDSLRRGNDLETALARYEASLSLRRAILDDTRRDGDATTDTLQRCLRDVSTALGRRGDIKKRLNHFNEALVDLEAALNMRLDLLSQDPQAPRFRRDAAVAHLNVALLLDRKGDGKDSIEHYIAYRETCGSLSIDDPSDQRVRSDFARGTMLLGDAHRRMGRSDEGCSLLREAVELYESMTTDQPDNARLRQELEQARGRLARCSP